MLYQNTIKRLLDIILSLFGIIALSWLLVILAIIVKCTSKGPILFCQRRIGINKKEFYIYKFRTMYIDTPKDMPTHLLENPEQYITPIGKFMRKTSLDELPQLFNILSGEMSVVGPRPALWNQYDLIALRDKNGANAIRPGLTGLAQVSGRDELPINKKAKLDGKYTKKISFLLDFWIVLRTIESVLKHDGVKEGGVK